MTLRDESLNQESILHLAQRNLSIKNFSKQILHLAQRMILDFEIQARFKVHHPSFPQAKGKTDPSMSQSDKSLNQEP